MPHQRHIVDVGLEIDPETGLLAFSEVVVIGPRQATGKTELMLPVMTHRCVGFDRVLHDWVARELGVRLRPAEPQTVLYTTQTSDKAKEKWRDVHLARLKRSSFYRRRQFTPRLQRNLEAMIWANGSMWSPGSTTGKTSGTGDTLDLGVIDEAWSRPNSRTELGMRPAMMSRDWRQLWVLSMIPGLVRVRPDEWPYLRRKRELGRARVAAGVRRGMAFFDYAAAPGSEPGDPATWYSCMPGLGFTVREQAIAEDFDSGMDLVDFCAEYLGWEPVETRPRWTLIRQETWEQRFDPTSTIQGRPVLSVEVDEERTHGWIGAVGYRPDGHYHVEVLEPGNRIVATVSGIEWMERRLVDLVADHNPWTVVIDPRRPAASLIQPLRNRGIDVLTPSQPDIAGACGRFFDATGEVRPGGGELVDEQDLVDDDGLRLFHLDQPVLNRAMAQARRYDLGAGAFVIVRKGAGSEVGPLYTIILGMHGLVVKGAVVVPEPDIFI